MTKPYTANVLITCFSPIHDSERLHLVEVDGFDDLKHKVADFIEKEKRTFLEELSEYEWDDNECLECVPEFKARLLTQYDADTYRRNEAEIRRLQVITALIVDNASLIDTGSLTDI